MQTIGTNQVFNTALSQTIIFIHSTRLCRGTPGAAILVAIMNNPMGLIKNIHAPTHILRRTEATSPARNVTPATSTLIFLHPSAGASSFSTPPESIIPRWSETGTRQRGNVASVAIAALKLKFATAKTETAAPRVHKLSALRSAEVVGASTGNWGSVKKEVGGVVIGAAAPVPLVFVFSSDFEPASGCFVLRELDAGPVGETPWVVAAVAVSRSFLGKSMYAYTHTTRIVKMDGNERRSNASDILDC